MTTYGISMVRDEADVIEGTLRHTAAQVDYLWVADNRSTDGTRKILDRLSEELPLTVIDDDVTAYYQSRKMTALAELAGVDDGDWVVPFDADELWYCPGGRIGTVLDGLGSAQVARAALYNHLRTDLDDFDPDPFRSMTWRQRQPGALPKVAFRWQPGAVIKQGNHSVDLPWPGLTLDVLEIRHFPVRSAEHLMRKASNGSEAYKATDLDASEGMHWRGWGEILERGGPAAIIDVYTEHWHYRSPIDAGLIRDPAPYVRWQQ